MRTFLAALLLVLATAASAASKDEIDAEVRQALQEFRNHTSAGSELSNQGLMYNQSFEGSKITRVNK